jgi:hypothetical protein
MAQVLEHLPSKLEVLSQYYWEKKKKKKRLDAVVHVCNLNTKEAEAGGCEFAASLGYKARPCLNK